MKWYGWLLVLLVIGFGINYFYPTVFSEISNKLGDIYLQL